MHRMSVGGTRAGLHPANAPYPVMYGSLPTISYLPCYSLGFSTSCHRGRVIDRIVSQPQPAFVHIAFQSNPLAARCP